MGDSLHTQRPELPAADHAGKTIDAPLQPSPYRLEERASVAELERRGELLNNRPAVIAQRQSIETLSAARSARPRSRPVDRGGLPEPLKSGLETLSGFALDDVRVHRNSPRPMQMRAHAFAQGNSIHLAPGQERHIAHEAWHVVQQRQGRVRPTGRMKGAAINDDRGLEREADAMGAKALRTAQGDTVAAVSAQAAGVGFSDESMPIQGVWEKFTEPDPDWVYHELGGYYYNAKTGGRYYPDTGVLDHPSEAGGFQALEEDEAEALQRRIDSGHWNGLWVNSDDDMLFDPKERVLSFVGQPEIRVQVDARENYHTLLAIASDGGDVDAELREAHEELEGEGEEVPARQMTRGARVGFEFQQLGSKVRVTEAPAEAEDDEEDDDGFAFDRGDGGQADYVKALSSLPVRVPTSLYGRDQRWYVVADGENLEFVTQPFESMADLRETMAEVSYVASLFAEGDPGRSYMLGDTVVEIEKPEDQAQPQANPDIPLDTLHNFIEDLAGDEEMREDLFGVSTNFWNPEKTSEEMEMVFAANESIQGLASADLEGVFGLVENARESRAEALRGMLQLLANAAIHKAFFGGGLPKDQPILLKSNLAWTWRSLVESKAIGKDTAFKDVVDLLLQVSPDLADGVAQLKSIVRGVMEGRDPIWGSVKEPVSLDAEQPGRKQVLIEMRRVPVLPIGEWAGFAESTYHYFITDAAQRFS